LRRKPGQIAAQRVRGLISLRLGPSSRRSAKPDWIAFEAVDRINDWWISTTLDHATHGYVESLAGVAGIRGTTRTIAMYKAVDRACNRASPTAPQAAYRHDSSLTSSSV